MEEQNQNSVNLEIPSRWRRFSAYLLDLIINFFVISLLIYLSIIWLVYITSWIDSINPIMIFISLIIPFTLCILYISKKKTTIWNKSLWIITLNNENNQINWKQALLRYFVFNPSFLALILFDLWLIVGLLIYTINGWCNLHSYKRPYAEDPTCLQIDFIQNIILYAQIITVILLLISIAELFFKCPTFIDKQLWIKRIYKKSK
jgi:uncharacterized RDD family membrane protein YckC